MKEKIRTFFTRNTRSLRAILLIFSVALVIAIPVTIFVVNIEEPYFIIIKSDEDFLKWCDIGNSTVENPYVIEGHSITIPEYYETRINDRPYNCVIGAIIFITGVTKSFIIENNTLTMKNKCNEDNMIYIYDIEVPFIVRNNKFISGGDDKDALTLSSVSGLDSKISNNQFISGDIVVSESNNISFIGNNFHNSVSDPNYIRKSFNISFQFNFFINADLDFFDCSDVVLHNNTFDYRNMSWLEVIGGDATYFTRYTNNTFIHSGISVESPDRIPLAFEGNIINRKPLGFFYNLTNLSIDNTTQYGQIILLQCVNVSITGQNISNTPFAIQISKCITTNVKNCKFTGNRIGVLLYESNRTHIEENAFHYIDLGTWDQGIYGYYADGLYMRRNLFVRCIIPIALNECTDVVDENNTITYL